MSCQVGMGNADYVAAFLHLLLPLAFEVTARRIPPGQPGGRELGAWSATVRAGGL